jgi:diguanylate cyclase (GGDEF)-like protein
MKMHELIIRDVKAELLTLYVDSEHNFNNFNDYFMLFQKSIFKFFDIKNSCFFVLQEDLLKVVNELNDPDLMRSGIPWKLVEPSFKHAKIVEPPNFLVEQPTFSSFNQMLLLTIEDEKPFGIVLFEATHVWMEFANSPYVKEFKNIVSSLFKVIYRSIELRANESHYRKLYNMTDLFHSTMDIDVILENVLATMAENFKDLQVELILSNDQDRQTKVHIKQFDYLEERASTIEAFVSGELTIDIDANIKKQILNAPIKGQQAIYGILQVVAPLTFVYTQEQKNFIRMLANASGNALENAKLYAQSHRLIADLQLINETSHRLNLNLNVNEMLLFLQKQLMKSSQPKEIAFAFKNEQYELSNVVTEGFLNAQNGLYLQHVEKHFDQSTDPLFIADFGRLIGKDVQYKSLMAIPMLVEEQINGYCIVLHEDPYYFSFDSFKLIQSLIHHSSLAISNSVLRSKLQEMVDRDHLTKLYARRFLDRYVENSLMTDESGMFFLIDIDNFKRVNDTYGHQIGDEVLVQIANQLMQMIGTRGICARWGGEELAVYIPNLLEDEAHKIANQIVEAIPTVTNPMVTISAGLVPWKQGTQPEFQAIFLQADTALYEAKHNGKNQYCTYHEQMQMQ